MFSLLDAHARATARAPAARCPRFPRARCLLSEDGTTQSSLIPAFIGDLAQESIETVLLEANKDKTGRKSGGHRLSCRQYEGLEARLLK